MWYMLQGHRLSNIYFVVFRPVSTRFNPVLQGARWRTRWLDVHDPTLGGQGCNTALQQSNRWVRVVLSVTDWCMATTLRMSFIEINLQIISNSLSNPLHAFESSNRIMGSTCTGVKRPIASGGPDSCFATVITNVTGLRLRRTETVSATTQI